MKILYVVSDLLFDFYGNHCNFIFDYVRLLRKKADVYCVCLYFAKIQNLLPYDFADLCLFPDIAFETYSFDGKLLEIAASFRAQLNNVIENFKPDIIHCNDKQSFLSFRFDKNVLYSSHLNSLDKKNRSLFTNNEFQEVKMERCALQKSSVLSVYSDFSATNAIKMTGGLCSPIVLPLGINFPNKINQKFYNGLLVAEKSKYSPKHQVTVCYFGDFENETNGINDFIYAVNILGKDFKDENNLKYCLYGTGQIDFGVDVSLFDKIEELKDEALSMATKNADIVVLPNRYETFGLTALNAMSNSSLVLLPRGLGMDMYADFGLNCLELSHNVFEIAETIKDAVINFSKYDFIRKNASKTAKKWSVKRSVDAHFHIYSEMKKDRISLLTNAYSNAERKMLEKYKKSEDIEKTSALQTEIKIAETVVNYFQRCNFSAKILVLTGIYLPDQNTLPRNIEFFSVLNESDYGFVVRPECLPFDDKEFDTVIFIGSWETVLNVQSAFNEAKRISKNKIIITQNNDLYSWQTKKIECASDWKKITSEEWKISDVDDTLKTIGDLDKIIIYENCESKENLQTISA